MKKNIHLLLICICTMLALAPVQAQTFTSVDIYTGADSSNPSVFTTAIGKLFFQANDGIHGRELWVSDGTAAGTEMLGDIFPGIGNSSATGFIAFNNKVYFSANDSVHGVELWVTDGTPGGTGLLADINPGTGSSNPFRFIVWNNELIFGANDGTNGAELWKTDGTTLGTTMIADINPGAGSSSAGGYSPFYAYNSKLYFSATDGTHGVELWVTDGTSGGTSLVSDIFTGAGNSYPGNTGFITLNNKMYFQAGDSLHGTELWTSDGTTLGTAFFDEIYPGANSSQPTGFIAYNSKIYFSANDGVHGVELWTSDGTVPGTLMVKDINADTSASSSPGAFNLFNNKIYFGARGNGNFQLWATDGTTAGTVQITNKYPSHGFNVFAPVVVNNLLFFQGQDSIIGWQLYSLNSSDNITLLAPAIAPNLNPLFSCYSMVGFNNSLAYSASYNSIGVELWFYTPANAAIGHVDELNGISAYPNPFTGSITLNGLQPGLQYRLKLTDIQGRDIDAYEITGTGAANTLQLPATLAGGVYMLQLSNNGATETLRLVKQ